MITDPSDQSSCLLTDPRREAQPRDEADLAMRRRLTQGARFELREDARPHVALHADDEREAMTRLVSAVQAVQGTSGARPEP